tara:strand:+ start:174 stop:1043 length:870 start_codon:yes stop_codon:yes gene_type:complete
MTSTLFVEEIKGRTTGTNANKVIVPSGQTLTINSTIGGTGGITLDANQDVELDGGGLYVTNPANSLTVDKGGIDRTGNTTRIFSARSGGNYADMSINIAGVDKSDGNNGMNRCLYIDYQGNTTLDQGNLIIGTSGKGISFAATADGSGSSQSELLDDYEEGSWTATLPNGGSVSIAASSFVKVGRLVYAGAYITVSSIPNDTALFAIGGLPYVVKTGSHYYAASALTYIHTSNANDVMPPTPYSGGGASLGSSLYFHQNDGTSAALTNTDVVGRGYQYLIFAITYVTDA